ncbi:unnamed protein product [Paramecium sonneborni]|uniref:Transmembrane protein n=1 Tax=Paramecium sonneborni TaxID=65129 RepID=A0A8S1Q348_9CILI|nr:unnamed protein product [Paramecium sonneborni]
MLNLLRLKEQIRKKRLKQSNMNKSQKKLLQQFRQKPKANSNLRLKAQSSYLSCLRSRPDPQLVWESHVEKNLMSDFNELIESRFNEFKRSSSIYKYFGKIGFQVFIYLLNILELIFPLSYGSYNGITADTSFALNFLQFFVFYFTVVPGCTLMNLGMSLSKVFLVIQPTIYYMFMGGLSYFQIAPSFIILIEMKQLDSSHLVKLINIYNQVEKINLEIHVYFFKERTKPINIFRDFIFHRVALISMIITMIIQTIPQLFIQGFYNTDKEVWDGFNVFSYLLFMSNLSYYFVELQFIVFTTTYRQMQTQLQFKLKKIKLKIIQETKQLLKSDQKNIWVLLNLFIFIMIQVQLNNKIILKIQPLLKDKMQIIKALIKQKKFKNIQFLFIDQYEDVTLQYLSNCFKLINVHNILLLYQVENRLPFVKSIILMNVVTIILRIFKIYILKVKSQIINGMMKNIMLMQRRKNLERQNLSKIQKQPMVGKQYNKINLLKKITYSFLQTIERLIICI